MQHWKRLIVLASAGLIVLGILYVVFSLFFLDFIVDLWWYKSLGQGGYFWLRLLYRYAVFAAVTLAFFLVFFLNFWVASRYLGNASSPESNTDAKARQAYQALFKLFRSGSLKVYTPLSLALGILVAYPLFERWETALFYLFGPAAGAVDPVYGKDIGYYLFSLPVYSFLQRRLMLAFLILLASMIFLYWLEHRLLAKQEERLPRGAKIHLSALILTSFGIEIWNFILQRYELLYTSSHPLFFGPGFVEMWVILPLIWLSLLLLACTALSVVYSFNSRKGFKLLVVLVVAFAIVLGARYSRFLPGVVGKYIVKPNEFTRETPYINNSISATLAAYQLGHVEIREFTPKRVPTITSETKLQERLLNVPVWYRDVLLEVYKQLQTIRTYYEFTGIDVDRYTVNSLYQQVFVSARELNLDALPESARNWVNEHLKYTHGYGVAMNPAAQNGEEPVTWFIGDIPSKSNYGLTIQQPGIYYGLGSHTYVIAPNRSREFEYPLDVSNVSVDYQGHGGVPINSLFRKLLFAVYFKEKNIFFTPETNQDSRMLFRRNVQEAIRTLTPYLVLDNDPYAVITTKGIYWIQDAYTVSDWYPNAQPYGQLWHPNAPAYPTASGGINYIRNSVKIVVDAYNGDMDYYVADPQDPIIRAYGRMYPGLLKDLRQIPGELKAHLRYPEDFFHIQMAIYAKYHQTDPGTFYKQEDIWEFARTFKHNTQVDMAPYYLTLNLIDPARHGFLLVSPMRPKALDNLRALAVVGCDDPDYGKIIVYSFPRSMVIYGPPQIDAIIDQDPTVAERFTLWNQVGSEVERGKLIIFPIEGTVVYIQPVYLKASARLKIPQLQRLIVTQGDVVVMDTSLENAVRTMVERLNAREGLVGRRSEPPQPTLPIPQVSEPQVTQQ